MAKGGEGVRLRGCTAAFRVGLSRVKSSRAMGQIEWAMWANEQALAAGLSECGVGVQG